MTAPLVGSDLLALVKENPELDTEACALRAGYSRVTRSGTTAPDLRSFSEAMFRAHGTPLAPAKRRRLSADTTSVHKNGLVVLSWAHIKKLGVGQTDVLNVIHDAEANVLSLSVNTLVPGSPLPIEAVKQRKAAPEATSETDVEETYTEDAAEEGNAEDAPPSRRLGRKR
jgi:hypothetical protein